MRLISLEITNFLSYAGGPHVVKLDRLGLVLLSGRNLDDPANNSNGAGKSTVLEALTWALFGEGLPRRQGNAERGVSGDEVCPDRVGQQTRVEVVLEDEITGQNIGVARWRKYKDTTAEEVTFEQGATGVPVTTKSVSRARTNGVLIRVGENGPERYLDMAEGDRRIRDVLGITRDIWCRSVVFGQESQFNFCEATSKERADILTTVMGLEVVDRWLGRARDERTLHLRELARVEGALEATLKARTAVHDDNPAAKAETWEATRGERRGTAQARQAAVAENGKGYSAALAARYGGPVDQRLKDALAEEQAAQAALAAVPEAVEPDPGPMKAAHEALTQARQAEAVAMSSFKRVEALEGVSVCPTCTQPVDQAKRTRMLGEFNRQFCEAQAAAAQAAGIADTAARAHQQARLAAQGQTGAARQAALQRIQAAHTARVAAEFEVRGRDDVRDQVEKARTEWRREAETIKSIEAEVNPYAAIVDQRHLRLHELAEEIKRLEEKRGTHQEAVALLTWWDQEFPRFKTWLFDSIVDSLAAEANRWLRVMSAGVIWVQITTSKKLKSGDVRDDLDVQVFRWNTDGSITSRPYRIWSGGEKRRVSLAVDLGLSRLMATRASKAYRFLALDEVDRHLDAQGCEGLRAVLEELRAERETCLVITHDTEFRASFDLAINVVKQAGTSRLEVKRAEEAKAPGEEPAADPSQGSVVSAGEPVRPARKKGARGKRRAGGASGDAGAAGGGAAVPGADEREH